MKIETALEKFVTQLQADGRSPHTIGQYRRHVRLLAHWVRDVGHSQEIKKISHETLARFLSSPTAQMSAAGGPKKTGSVNALRSSMKCFFSYLHRAGYIPTDPGRLIRRAICGRPLPRALADEEASKLMTVLEAGAGFEARRDHLLFHLMLGTGVRLGSALALEVADVDLDSGTIRLRHTKGDREEQVFLGPAIPDHLRGYLDGRTSGLVFTTRRGRRPSLRHLQRRFALAWKKTGISRAASIHSLRHTLATNLYRKTHDLLLVQQALRHRSIASTLVYARADERRLREALTM